ncbi:MAG: H/ACA ribonucleoprotein complex subunit GAR1 [Candidatus Helarchaeota archaeon]
MGRAVSPRDPRDPKGYQGLMSKNVQQKKTDRGVFLRKLGQVLHVFPPNDIIVKSNSKPKISGHVKVINKEMCEIGRIKEIFGPVNAPYISIRPKIKVDASLIGEPVYLWEK